MGTGLNLRGARPVPLKSMNSEIPRAPELKINAFANYIRTWREGRGFLTPINLQTEENRNLMLGKLMLCVTEDAEMAEAVRSGDIQNFKEELADSVIRHLDIAATVGIDLEEEMRKKMGVNYTRPHKHGRLCSL